MSGFFNTGSHRAKCGKFERRHVSSFLTVFGFFKGELGAILLRMELTGDGLKQGLKTLLASVGL